MDVGISDIVFVIGVVGLVVGAIAQDHMRRRLHTLRGDARRARQKARVIARRYREAWAADEAHVWPLYAFYLGFTIGYGGLVSALLMLVLL